MSVLTVDAIKAQGYNKVVEQVKSSEDLLKEFLPIHIKNYFDEFPDENSVVISLEYANGDWYTQMESYCDDVYYFFPFEVVERGYYNIHILVSELISNFCSFYDFTNIG